MSVIRTKRPSNNFGWIISGTDINHENLEDLIISEPDPDPIENIRKNFRPEFDFDQNPSLYMK